MNVGEENKRFQVIALERTGDCASVITNWEAEFDTAQEASQFEEKYDNEFFYSLVFDMKDNEDKERYQFLKCGDSY